MRVEIQQSASNVDLTHTGSDASIGHMRGGGGEGGWHSAQPQRQTQVQEAVGRETVRESQSQLLGNTCTYIYTAHDIVHVNER